MKVEKSVTVKTVNQNILNIKYAVRGPIVQRAMQIENELKKGAIKPFTRVVRGNCGDCHATGQKPITFIRQVLAVTACPQLLESEELPRDVRERARALLECCIRGSVGAYTPSAGLTVVRRHCAEYIARRDGGVPASGEHVYLGSGASDIIKSLLRTMLQPVDGKKPSVMVPIPQYPLFSSTLAEFGFHQADYYLDEERDWSISYEELERSWSEASELHNVRALVVINPGNPTGQLLTEENMELIVKFAYTHNLFLLADEVYQENLVSKPFVSFKKKIHTTGTPYSTLELASFLTASKGWAAECGLRCGYAEIVNVDGAVRNALDVTLAVMQCPTVLGQIALDCIVKPPQPGEESYALFRQERDVIQDTLNKRCSTAYETFNSIPGLSHTPIDGAMFAFPRVQMPEKFLHLAATLDQRPDDLYCLRLLEETGVCVVPGSGFGQKPGTFHFRTTILHQEDEFQYMLDSFRKFHAKFLSQYH